MFLILPLYKSVHVILIFKIVPGAQIGTPMADAKRWSVTYTKHVKQKRKVYQDGFLELHSSSSKVMLYDECEKLLESRFLKKDDFIESGETLVFDSHLVDIGEPCGNHKVISSLSFQGKDEKVLEKSGSFHSNKFGHNSVSADRKTDFGKDKARSINLSPSQRIIREFKKSETNKYHVSPSCPNASKSSKTEWQVLYTTHIRQKSKKFHDGFLQLVVRGSQGRQIMLYDTTRRLLDSRFLKRDEIISSGESLVFEGHLVDIGELEGDQKPPKELACQDINYKAVGKTETTYNQANFLINTKFPAGETLNKISPDKCMDLNGRSSEVDDAKVSWMVPANKPRRAAFEILSNLRKPMIQENPVLVKEESSEPLSSDDIPSNFKKQLQEHSQECNGSVLKELNRKMISLDDHSTKNLKSESVDEVLPIGAGKLGVHDNHGKSQAMSSRLFLRSGATNCLTPILNVQLIDDINLVSVSPALEPQALMATFEVQTPIASVPSNSSNKNFEIGSSTELVSQKENSNTKIALVTPGFSSSNLPKLFEDDKGTAARCHKGAPHVRAVSFTGCIAHNPSDVKELKQDSSSIEMADFPSFDLGF